MRFRWIVSTLAVVGLAILLASKSIAQETDNGPSFARNPLRDLQASPLTSRATAPLPTDKVAEFERLRAELRGDNPTQAIVAVYRLQEFGAAGAELLLQSLVEPSQPMEIRFSTLTALEKIGPAAVPSLLRLMDDELHSAEAWQLLARMGPAAADAVPKLIAILIDETKNDDDRAQAAYTIGKIGHSAIASLAPLLETAERVENDELKLACISSIAEIGSIPKDCSDRLLKMLLNDEGAAPLRAAAGAVLVNLADPPEVVIPGLIGLLQDHEDWNVCISAADSLGKLGGRASDAVPALIRLFDHESKDVKLAAIGACGEMGSGAQGAIPALIHRIQSDESDGVPESAAHAATKIDPASIHAILAGLDGDETTQQQTLLGLTAIGPRGEAAIPQLLRMLADEEKPDRYPIILRAFRNMGEGATAATGPIASLLANDTQLIETRMEAALALGSIHPVPSAELFDALRDQEPAVRIAAAQALGTQDLRRKVAIPALLKELSDSDTAESAAAALITIGNDVVAPLGQLALDASASVDLRVQAIDVLGRTGQDAVPILIQALSSPEEEVARAAEQALSVLGPRIAVPALLLAISQAMASPTPDPMAQEALVERMTRIIADLSGGLGGGAIGAVGAAPPGPGSASSAPDFAPAAPRSFQPKSAARATGPVVPNTTAAEKPAELLATKEMDLKVIDVYYGTNRRPIGARFLGFAFVSGHLFPAVGLGIVTMVVCGIAVARARSKWLAGLSVTGMIATLCLVIPLLQQPVASSSTVVRRPGPVFGGESCDQLEVGLCHVTIPADHRPGELESPSILRLEFEEDPRKHIVVRDVSSLGLEQFHTSIQQNLITKGNNILVFVHGYNVDFDDAARRTAQLACDLEFAGVPVFFSWPSQANWYEYRKDEKQVDLAVPFLKEFLIGIAERSEGASIHLIAHSMGNRAPTTAIKEISIAGDLSSTQFNQVILAAPDIDADTFRKRIAPAIVTKAERVTLYASSNDLALLASRTFNSGDLRAGDTSRGLMITPGIETIDVSAVDTSLLGHSYYGDSPSVLSDLKELLQSARSAAERPFLQPVALDESRYWIFHHPTVANQRMDDALRRYAQKKNESTRESGSGSRIDF